MSKRAADDFAAIGARLRELEHGKIEPIGAAPVDLRDVDALTAAATAWMTGSTITQVNCTACRNTGRIVHVWGRVRRSLICPSCSGRAS